MSSKMMTICEEVQTKLESVTALAGVPVILDRNQDLQSDIEREVARMNAAILVYRGAAPKTNTRDPQPEDGFYVGIEIEVHTMPITAEAGTLGCDEIAEIAAAALDGWMRPTAPSPSNDDRMIVTGIYPVPDKDFLIWRVSAKVRMFL